MQDRQPFEQRDMMFDFEHRLSELTAQTVLCVGDLMLDEFVYGEVSRISPEAATPVIAVSRQELLIGGAGNVARNIAALGARCLFVGIVGEDDAARTLTTALAAETRIEPHLVVDRARPTTRKVRFVSERHETHMLRADWELESAIKPESEQDVIARALSLLPRADAVVMSDYAKGVLTAAVIRAVIDAARDLGKPVVVDPKGTDYAVYRGATLITPNRRELAAATRLPAVSDGEIAAAAAELGRIVESEAVLATRSEEGMTLLVRGHEPIHIPGYPVKVRDMSGAGDTAAAVLAALLAMGADFEAAARAANAAAAVVVGKRGTATVSLAELRARILPAASLAFEEKIIFDWSTLDERLDQWRRQDLRIGFTNGHFDILHPGHLKVLTEARAACDRLVVGLNSDASTVRLKGPGRPIQNEQARAELLAGFEAVDLVVVFGEDTPLELIRRVRPTVLVKGGDYRHDEVVGHEVVEAAGGVVLLVDIVPGHSTTRLIDRSRRSEHPEARRSAKRSTQPAAERAAKP
jgi:D-beta-D-heptose 7-phosphate kinase/D-beta-D-heptose 1-phosphate adenosyltransferase